MPLPFDEFKQLLKDHRYNEAAFLAEKIVTSGRGNKAFWLNQHAVAMMRMNRFEEAMHLAEQALEHTPRGYYSLIIRAEILYLSGDTIASLAGFKDALAYPPVETRAHKGILDCLMKLHRFDEALNLIAGITIDPITIWPYKIKALRGLGRIDEAIEICTMWHSRSVDDRTALELLCDLEVQRDGIAAVLSKYELMAQSPARQPVYGDLCTMLRKKMGKTTEESISQGSHSGKQGGTFIMRRKAFMLAKTGKDLDAIPLFEEFLRTAPADHYVNNTYIAAARRSGYLMKARAYYRKLFILYPHEKSILNRIRKISQELEQV